ncbi:TPA: staphylococcal enterotoxin type G [Staphylococcus aureus]
MKKLSTVIIILILEIVFHNMNYVNAQPDPKLDELNKVSDYKNNKGTMGNVMNLYTSPPVEGRGVINSRQFLSHDLIFPIEHKSYNEVKTELENTELANNYKDKKVDIFGVPYFYTCIIPKSEPDINQNFGGCCMYGGLTFNSSENERDKLITVQVTIDNRQSLGFTITTNKNMVTIQELDYKARHWLTKEKKLYEFDGSAFESGYIKFTEKNNTSFWFDLFPKKELVPFVPYKFLNIYGDNKVVDSKSIKMEVFLNTH